MSTFTYSESTTFTVTHARHIAAKVSADLKRMQRFYGCPSDGEIANYDDPGRVRPGLNVSQATFYNYLTHSPAWDALPANEKDAFEKRMPFERSGKPEPTVNGYLIDDKVYSAGGRALNRATVRAY